MGTLTRKNPYNAMPDISKAWLFEELYDHRRARAQLEFHDLDMDLKVTWSVDLWGEKKGRWIAFDRSPISWMIVPPARGRQTTVIFAIDRDAHLGEKVTDLSGKRNYGALSRMKPDRFTNFAVFKKRPNLLASHPGAPVSFDKPELFTQEEYEKDYKPANWGQNRHHDQPDGPSRGFSSDAMELAMADITLFKPKVVIWRCQIDDMMPRFGEPFSYESIFAGPFLVVPRLDKKDPITIDNTTPPVEIAKKMYDEVQKTRLQHIKGVIRSNAYLEWPHPGGLRIQHVKKAFTIDLVIGGSLYRPAAYNYVIAVRGVTVIFGALHSDNIDVSALYEDDVFEKGLVVLSRSAASTRDIPSNNLKPKYNKIKWKLIEPRNLEAERRKLFARLLFEVGISFIPVIGTLYDLGQIAYIYHTGNDFFGAEVSPEEFAVYGVAVGIGVVASGSKLLSGMVQDGRYLVSQRVINEVSEHINLSEDQFAKFSRLAGEGGAVDPSQIERIARASGEIGALETIALMPSATHNQLIAKLSKRGDLTRKGARDVLETLAKHFDKTTALPSNIRSKTIHDVLHREAVLKLINSSGKAFKNNFLNGHYQDYVKKAKGTPASAVEWVSRKTRRPEVKAFLQKRLGRDYQEILEDAIYGRGLIIHPKTITPDVAKVYDSFFTKGGVDTYEKIEKARSKLPKELRRVFADLFEIDHLVERRFFEKWFGTDEFNAATKLRATLVPHRPDVAEALINAGNTQVKKIAYVHTAKTHAMQRLIPHGSEHLFTMQEIVDAHLYVFKQLDVHFDPHIIKGDIDVLFQLRHGAEPGIAGPTMTSLRSLTEETVRKSAGWPIVRKNATGVWERLN